MILYTLRNRGCSNTFIKNLFSFHKAKINQLTIRSTSQSPNVYPDHELIYKFPFVRLASLINKLKLYQTFATVAGIPMVTILAACDVITFEMAMIYVSTGITWSLPLFAIGFLGTNRVGFIHLREDKKSIKISYADFWGRKVVVDALIQDIWPISDMPTINPLYYSLRRYSTKKSLKFNVRHAVVVDADKFQLVFGKILDNKIS